MPESCIRQPRIQIPMAGQTNLPARNAKHSWFTASVRIMARDTGSEYKWPMIIAALELFSCVAFEAQRTVRVHKLCGAADIRNVVTEHAHRFFGHEATGFFGYLLFVAIDAGLPE